MNVLRSAVPPTQKRLWVAILAADVEVIDAVRCAGLTDLLSLLNLVADLKGIALHEVRVEPLRALGRLERIVEPVRVHVAAVPGASETHNRTISDCVYISAARQANIDRVARLPVVKLPAPPVRADARMPDQRTLLSERVGQIANHRSRCIRLRTCVGARPCFRCRFKLLVERLREGDRSAHVEDVTSDV